MNYQLTEIDTHIDFGFGITGESYHSSAEYLYKNKENIVAVQQVEMPFNYLYRHSIELFLKSLIIIFHRKLKLPYGNESFNSEKPKVLTGGIWKDLYTCHWIDELYSYWLTEILLKHKSEIEKLAPDGDWQDEVTITKLFPLIAKYDRDSSFFRYPVTKNSSFDSKKHTIQRFDIENIQSDFFDEHKSKDKKAKRLLMLIEGEEGKITDAFERKDEVLSEVTMALKEVSYYFYCIHIMTRITLCDSY